MNFERPDKDPDYKRISPEPLHQFKELEQSDRIFLPELPKNRKLTDFAFLVVFGIALTVFTIWSVYIFATTSIGNVVNGHDECGNVCGRKNYHVIDKLGCVARDCTEYPIALYVMKDKDLVSTRCIKAEHCNGTEGKELLLRRCFPRNKKSEEEAAKYKYRIFDVLTQAQVGLGFLGMLIFSIGGTLLVYVFFRLHVVRTFYALLVLAFIMFLTFSAVFWYLFATTFNYILLFLAVVFTMFFFMIIFLVIKFYKRFKLVTDLFEEAVEIIFKSPLLLAVPLSTNIFTVGAFASGVYLMIVTIGDTGAISESEWCARICFACFLIFMTIWLLSFASGCQCMIVAGTAAAYYFNTDKSLLHKPRPFFASVFITLRYHLGTVAFGSLLLSLIKVLKLLVECTRHNDDKPCCMMMFLCLECMISCLEEIFEYLTKKAYIMTAIHGRNLFTSGRRAGRLLWHFLLDTMAVDLLGASIMGTAALLVMVAAMGIGYTVIYPAVDRAFPQDVRENMSFAVHLVIVLILLTAFIALLVVVLYCTSVMNVIVETVFLCFSEDKLLNDGSQEHPYYMSYRFLQVMIAAWELAAKEREPKKRRNLNQR